MPIQFLSQLFAPKINTDGNQSVSGAGKSGYTPALQKTSEVQPWAAVTNSLEGGNNNPNQYVNKRVGFCNPICIA